MRARLPRERKSNRQGGAWSMHVHSPKGAMSIVQDKAAGCLLALIFDDPRCFALTGKYTRE